MDPTKVTSTLLILFLTTSLLAGCAHVASSNDANRVANSSTTTLGTTTNAGGNNTASTTSNSVAFSNGTSTNSAPRNAVDTSATAGTAAITKVYGSTNSTPPSQTNATIRFSSPIIEAMKYIQQGTKMPLFAPTLPTFQPSAKGVTAEALSSSNEYAVDIYDTDTTLRVNDPSLAQLGPDAIVASYTGQSYTSITQAMNALQETKNLFPVDHRQAGAKADLGSGITGMVYPYKAYGVKGYSVTEWHEGKWTIEVYGTPSDMKDNIEKIVAYLHANFLPMTTGIMQVDPPVATGPSTSLTWVFGSHVYTCSTRSSMAAMELATSMREYPTYRSIP